jgi:uncharacterized repeat protein (TIGR03803 family)
LQLALYPHRGTDGKSPNGNLIIDAAGSLYGTTVAGGKRGGTVFKMNPDGVHTVLYSFKGGDDARFPASGLLADGEGNV